MESAILIGVILIACVVISIDRKLNEVIAWLRENDYKNEKTIRTLNLLKK